MFRFVRITKCCPWGSYLDEWYNCVPTREDNDQAEAEAIFHEGIKGLGGGEVTLEVDDKSWRGCARHDLKELDVLHILKDNSSSYAYAIIDLNIDQTGETETEAELLTSGVKKMKYLCLDQDLDLPPHLRSFTALVCLTEPPASSSSSSSSTSSSSSSSWLVKCCAPGWDLSPASLECQPSPGLPPWPGPRTVLEPRTMTAAATVEVRPAANTSCGPGHRQTVRQVSSVLSDGRVLSGEKMSDYHCVDRRADQGEEEEVAVVAVVCTPLPCSHPDQLCVSKCCPPHLVFLHSEDPKDGKMCGLPSQAGQLWTNTRGQVHHTNLSVMEHSGPDTARLSLSHSFLQDSQQCRTFVIQARNDKHLLISNGSLYHPETGFKDNFCIDNGITSDGEVVEMVVECYEDDHHHHDLLHHQEHVQDHPSPRSGENCLQKYGGVFRLMNTISCILSVVFLSLTALVYIFVPDLNYLQGKIILSNVLATFFLSVFLLIIYNKQHIFSYYLCISLGYFGYFSTMSMFSWMTIMSFDVCWMLKQSKMPRRDSRVLRFLVYSVLGWGSSGLLTLLVASLDHIATDLPAEYKPNIGAQHCFVQNSSHGLYLHLPISVFMILNGILFVTTICVVYRLGFNFLMSTFKRDIFYHQNKYSFHKN